MTIGLYSDGQFNPGSTGTSWTTLDGPESTAACVQFVADLHELVAGDTVEFRLLEAARSGGTARVAWQASFTGVPAEPLFVSPTLLLLYGWSLEARQTAGTVRDFDWSIRAVA